MATRWVGNGDSMTHKPVLVFPERYRAQLAPLLPNAVELRCFSTLEEALELAPQAEIGWFDEWASGAYTQGPRAAVNARWINTVIVGLDAFPVQTIIDRGQIFTNGAGMMP